ncbi:hypothetical protein CARN8_3150002 [mine drainage metagenome]|uniref:Uncharacterized protein n=1 Tax=mine drainage metagenome TaxID=410659 RepID=A0A3P3ZNT1_9ZZZZ
MKYLINGSKCIVTKTRPIHQIKRRQFLRAKMHFHGAFYLKSTIMVRTEGYQKIMFYYSFLMAQC